MRKLRTADALVFCRCVKRLGLKEQLRNIAMNADTAKDVWNQGFDIIWTMFDMATEKDGEAAIYEFLAGPFEMTTAQVANLDLDVLMANLKQLAEENNLSGFFKTAAGSMR
jgi:hypothetical protein